MERFHLYKRTVLFFALREAKNVRYSDEILDDVKSSNDIVDVISQYISLKRSGRNYFGLCPFHNEKTPSFSVNEEKGFYHCFGCGEHGDIISFTMKSQNVTIFSSPTKLLFPILVKFFF